MRALVWLSGEAGDEGRGRYSYKKYPAEAEGYEWEMAPERARAGRELMQHFLANRGDDETANMWADVIVGTTRDLGSQALIVARVSTRELRYRHAPFEHPSKPSGVPEMMVVEKFLAQECHSHRPRT